MNIKWKNVITWAYIHWKAPVMVSFLVQLQPWRLTILWKWDSILDVFCEFCEVLQNHFLRKTTGRLLPIFSNISDISLALLAINQFCDNWMSAEDLHKARFASNSQCLSQKYLKWPRLKETFILAEVNVTNKKRVFSRSSHTEVFCKKRDPKNLVKLTGKHLCWSLSLACRRKETPA